MGLARRTRVGAASRRRVRRGGKLALGRPSATKDEYAALLLVLKRRSGNRCENPWCRKRGKLDRAHIKARSQGGSDDPDNVVYICRPCHERLDVKRDIRVTYLPHVPLCGGFMWVRHLGLGKGTEARIVQPVVVQPEDES